MTDRASSLAVLGAIYAADAMGLAPRERRVERGAGLGEPLAPASSPAGAAPGDPGIATRPS